MMIQRWIILCYEKKYNLLIIDFNGYYWLNGCYMSLAFRNIPLFKGVFKSKIRSKKFIFVSFFST